MRLGRRTVPVLLALPAAFVLATSGCGARSAGAGKRAPVVVAEAPSCPSPPALFDGAATRGWLRQCREVAEVTAANIAQARDAVRERQDLVRYQCLSDHHAAAVRLGRRISAERMALGGMGRERAVTRIRRHCLRLQALLLEARDC